MAFAIWQETSGSGAGIGLALIPLNRLPIREVRIRPRAACPVAAAGSTPPGSVGRRSASGARRTTGAAPGGSAWPEVCRASRSGELSVKSRPAAEPGAEGGGVQARSRAIQGYMSSSRPSRRRGRTHQAAIHLDKRGSHVARFLQRLLRPHRSCFHGRVAMCPPSKSAASSDEAPQPTLSSKRASPIPRWRPCCFHNHCTC
jgi:hypothetical protein